MDEKDYIKQYKKFWDTDEIKCGHCGKIRTKENKTDGGWVCNGELIFWFCSEECYKEAIRKLY